MPRINVPLALMADVEAAMTSTSETILKLRSAACQVFSESSADPQSVVRGINWRMQQP